MYAMSQEGEVVLWQPEQGINEDEVWGSIWQWAREVWLES
ncbi:SMI1/KNR4 family protein [Salmonella sp. s54395]